jgi:hypothetical protein
MRSTKLKKASCIAVVSESEKINNIGSKSDWWGGFIKFGKKKYFPNSPDISPGHWNILPGKNYSRSLKSLFSRFVFHI